tara:strand:- start:164 stop:982 length:819 start_codon:yes stop_codon:yes gene_type:complete
VATVSALYGLGVYGSSEYGVINVSAAVSSVPLTGAVNIVEAKVDEPLGSVSATGAVNTVTVNLSEILSGVSATFTINGAGLDVRSINRVPILGVSATGTIAPVAAGGFEIDISEVISAGASSTGSVGGVTVNVVEALAGVVGTTNTPSITQTHFSTIVISGVSATGAVNIVEEKPTEKIDSVSATSSVNSLVVNLVEFITGVTATGSTGTLSPDDAITVFSATAYDRKHVVHVVPNALVFRSVDTGAAATAYDRTRMVSVLPKQTSNHRRAA